MGKKQVSIFGFKKHYEKGRGQNEHTTNYFK